VAHDPAPWAEVPKRVLDLGKGKGWSKGDD